MPIIGLGTWKSKPNEVTNAVEVAVKNGYRHIDGAYVYQNEDEVGTALKNLFSEGIVKREELFITSKLWNTFHHPDHVEDAVRKTLDLLGLAYLDLYLIHWPQSYVFDGDNLFPVDDDGKRIASEDSYVETWKAMESLVEKGLVKQIGLSNFNRRQISEVIRYVVVVWLCGALGLVYVCG